MASTVSASPESLSSRAGTVHSLTGVQVLATGAYAPANIVDNEALADLGCDSEWIVQRTGILQRRHAELGQATSDLAFHAARRCLEQAGADISEVDLILVATMTPDTLTPSTACRLQQKLNSSAPAMDVNAACAGFMYAMVTGMQFVKSGCCRRVLVVGADLMSRFLNPDDKTTYPLFGDGAGAVLLGAGDSEQGLTSYSLGADGNGADLLCIPGCGAQRPATLEVLAEQGQFLQMNGRPVFKWAVRLIADSILDSLQVAGIAPSEIDRLILHQANVRIIDAAVESLQIEREKVFVNLDRYGNTSAGSIPLALAEADRAGKLRRGDNVVLCGFGAGLAWGTAVLHW